MPKTLNDVTTAPLCRFVWPLYYFSTFHPRIPYPTVLAVVSACVRRLWDTVQPDSIWIKDNIFCSFLLGQTVNTVIWQQNRVPPNIAWIRARCDRHWQDGHAICTRSRVLPDDIVSREVQGPYCQKFLHLCCVLFFYSIIMQSSNWNFNITSFYPP